MRFQQQQDEEKDTRLQLVEQPPPIPKALTFIEDQTAPRQEIAEFIYFRVLELKKKLMENLIQLGYILVVGEQHLLFHELGDFGSMKQWALSVEIMPQICTLAEQVYYISAFFNKIGLGTQLLEQSISSIKAHRLLKQDRELQLKMINGVQQLADSKGKVFEDLAEEEQRVLYEIVQKKLLPYAVAEAQDILSTPDDDYKRERRRDREELQPARIILDKLELVNGVLKGTVFLPWTDENAQAVEAGKIEWRFRTRKAATRGEDLYAPVSSIPQEFPILPQQEIDADLEPY